MSSYVDSVRVGGADGATIGHMESGTMKIQIYAGSTAYGADFLVTMYDGNKQVGMMELLSPGSIPSCSGHLRFGSEWSVLASSLQSII